MKKRAGAISAAFLLASCAPLLQGAIQISYSVNGGTDTICGTAVNSDGPVACSVSAPGANIPVLSASSNSPGTAALAEQFGATLLISSTAATNVNIWMAAQGFTAPTTPPAIKYSSMISVTSTAGTGSVNLTTCVDGADGLTPPITAFCASPEATLNNPAVTYSGTTGGGNTVSEIISSLTTTPYSLSQELTLTLGAGSNLNIITSQILTPVPEPASLVLLGSSLLGAGLLFRRKLDSKRS